MPLDERHRLEDYLDRLYGYAYSLCGDRDEAKDLVQECALRALSARRAPGDRAAYRAWLFKILRNHFFDRLRRRRVADGWAEEKSRSSPTATEYWTLDERLINAVTIRLELERLSPPHREIIGLIDLAGLSYAEAAACLEVPAGTIMSRISRARQALIAAIRSTNVHPLPAGQRTGRRTARRVN